MLAISELCGDLHADCIAALDDAVKLLRELGHDLIEITLDIDGTEWKRTNTVMMCGICAADVRDAERRVGKKASRAGFDRGTWVTRAVGESITACTSSVGTTCTDAIAAGTKRRAGSTDVRGQVPKQPADERDGPGRGPPPPPGHRQVGPSPARSPVSRVAGALRRRASTEPEGPGRPQAPAWGPRTPGRAAPAQRRGSNPTPPGTRGRSGR